MGQQQPPPLGQQQEAIEVAAADFEALVDAGVLRSHAEAQRVWAALRKRKRSSQEAETQPSKHFRNAFT